MIPKTVHKDRLAENLDLFRLNDEHFQMIDFLSSEKGTIRYLDPRDHIGFNVFSELRDEPIMDNAQH